MRKQYRDIPEKHITTGHCYIASEAIYHLCGGKNEWSSFTGRDHTGGTHWWLKNKNSGEIIDPTQEQYLFLGHKPPHESGRSCGFLTREPSKRAKVLIERILSIIEKQ